MTRPAILTVPSPDPAATGSTWAVRVFPNYYPVLAVEGRLEETGEAGAERREGVGAHEVIAETPRHGVDLGDLEVEQVRRVVIALRDRVRDLYQDRRLLQIVVFKNRGPEAGATVEHTHSQLVALPVPGDRQRRRIEASAAHFERTGARLVDELAAREAAEEARVVRDAAGFLTVAPYASHLRFELAILPRGGSPWFTELDEEAATGLAAALKDAIQRLRRALGDPPYNLVIHVEPNRAAFDQPFGDWDRALRGFRWQLDLVPRLAPWAGFEWGSGVFINSTPPEEAAALLRDIRLDD
jgi:UDPglucose--hexose-1-phosphate uridylyltransferase